MTDASWDAMLLGGLWCWEKIWTLYCMLFFTNFLHWHWSKKNHPCVIHFFLLLCFPMHVKLCSSLTQWVKELSTLSSALRLEGNILKKYQALFLRVEIVAPGRVSDFGSRSPQIEIHAGVGFNLTSPIWRALRRRQPHYSQSGDHQLPGKGSI